MHRRILASSVALGLIAVGCSAPRIDTSSDERSKESIAEVRKSLPEDQRTEFDEALQLIALQDLALEDLLAEGRVPGSSGLEHTVKERLNGKTGQEILDEGRRIRLEGEKKQREQALQEIHELEERHRLAEEARAALTKFEVTRSRFYKRPQRFGRAEPVIEMTVHNGTDHAVSRAYFLGTVASPGRSIPWIREDFNYSIAGGLEPGETATWKLAPNSFSEWGTMDVPSDAILTVEVVKLDGANEATLFDAAAFSESDAKRLEELRAKFQ